MKRILIITVALLSFASPAYALQSNASFAGDRNGSGNDHSNKSDGKCKNADQCQDNDFSPDLQNSQVIVCLPNSTCNFQPA